MVLQKPQQLDLEHQRQLTRLVEEDRAVIGQLEPADARGVGAGERPLFVPEQLGLHQVLGDSRAIDADEGLGRALAQAPDFLGNHLFAGAALAQHQHRHVDRRHLVDIAEERLHDRALAEDRTQPASPAQALDQLGVLPLEAPAREDAPQQDSQVLYIDRLPEEIGRPLFDGPPRILVLIVPGDQDDLHVGVEAEALFKQTEARLGIVVIQRQVQRDEIGVLLADQLPRALGVVRRLDAVVPAERQAELAQDRRIVIDDQQPGRRHIGERGSPHDSPPGVTASFSSRPP